MADTVACEACEGVGSFQVDLFESVACKVCGGSGRMTNRSPDESERLRKARLSGLRDAKRACLDEAAEMNVKRSRAISEKNAALRLECEARMDAAWSLYKKLDVVVGWAWNEETMLSNCEHRDGPKMVDERNGRAYCENCGMVFKAESV